MQPMAVTLRMLEPDELDGVVGGNALLLEKIRKVEALRDRTTFAGEKRVANNILAKLYKQLNGQ